MSLVLPMLLVLSLQQGNPTPGPAKPQANKTSEEAAWPKLPPAKSDDLLAKIALFKRAPAEKVDTQAKDLSGFGKGAVPIVLASYSRVDADLQPRFIKVLDLLTDEKDATRLLAETSSKSALIRAYVLKRSSLFVTKEHVPVLEKSLKDEDSDCRYYAGLGLSHAGSLVALDSIMAEVSSRWDSQRKEILKAVEGIRGPEASKKLVANLNNKEDDAALVSLRLLAGVGDQSAVTAVYFYLDSSNNRFKEEAVNALRGIVDKAPPVENLSVFDLIEQANKWKERLSGKKK